MSTRRIHPVPLLAGVCVAVLTFQLGEWQLRRADEKITLQYAMEAAATAAPVGIEAVGNAPEWLAVSLEGEWEADATVYLDNRVYRGQAGYHVLTPLRLADGAGWVLVERGWVAAGRDRSVLPAVSTPAGRVGIAGAVRHVDAGAFTLARQPDEGLRWQFIDLDRFRERSGLPVRNWVVQQHSDGGDALVRDWPQPDVGVDRHRGYALQWYSLAGLSVVLSALYVGRSLYTHAT